MAGPFGTYEALTLAGRLLCWGGIVGLAFLVGIFASALVTRGCRDCDFWRRQLLCAAIFTLIFLPMLRGAALALAGSSQVLLMNVWEMAAIVLMVPLCVGLVKYLWLRTAAEAAPVAEEGGEVESAPSARLLDRLTPEHRGAILHLSVRDHYVDVLTDRGKETILMRFSDAMAELDGLDGLQVHRSHWVATEAVAGNEKARGRVFLILVDGSRVPVSRSYQSEVAERGLI